MSENLIPVEGHNGFYRDEKTGAIINCNESEYNEYLKMKNRKINELNELDRIKRELDELRQLVYSNLLNKTK